MELINSNQRTFDMVVAHARKQGCKAAVEHEGTSTGISCKYRLGELKCFAGCLITDEQYTPDIENHFANSKTVGPLLRANGHDPDFVRELQYVHDYYQVEDWERHFQSIAGKHKLNYSL